MKYFISIILVIIAILLLFVIDNISIARGVFSLFVILSILTLEVGKYSKK